MKGYSFICPALIYILSQAAARAILCWSVWRAHGGGQSEAFQKKKACVLLTWQKAWTREPRRAHRTQICSSDPGFTELSCFFGVRGEWKEETGGQVSAGSCKHVSTSHTVPALCQRRQQEKNELKLWLACGRGWGIVRRGWLCSWKEEMSVCGWRREGKRGERERFPKLIKCSEGRKLPASIPVPLDKFARRSLQFLCSAEVASWGQLRGRGSGGWATHSKPFCAVGSSQPSEAAQLIICFWNYKQELQISHKFAWLSFALYSKRPATVFVWGVFCAFVPLIWKKGPIVYVLSVNSPGMRKVHLLLI